VKFIIEQERIFCESGLRPLSISPNEENGYRPYELFISSLIGCSGTLLRNILMKKRFAYERIEMEAAATRGPAHANRIESISITAYISADKGLTEIQTEKIVNLVIQNCGMIQSVIPVIDVKLSIQYSLPLPEGEPD